MTQSTQRLNEILKALALDLQPLAGQDITSRSPADGATLAVLKAHSAQQAQEAIAAAHQAYLQWRTVPAPADLGIAVIGVPTAWRCRRMSGRSIFRFPTKGSLKCWPMR
mgnify:CR=1 FL=1